MVGTSLIVHWSKGVDGLSCMIQHVMLLRSLLEHCFTRAYREKETNVHLELSSNLMLRF